MKLITRGEMSEAGGTIERPLYRLALESARGFLSRIRGDRRIAGLSAAWLAYACLFADASLAAGFVERPSTERTALPDATTTGSVTFRNGLLSVDVKNGPWQTTLARIKEQTGILFHCISPLEGTVTASFRDLPVKIALEQLFGPEAGFVYRYANAAEAEVQTGPPAEVWVLGRVQSSNADGAASGDSGREPHQAANTQNGVIGKGSARGKVQINQFDTRHLMEKANSSNPAVRLEALDSLAENGGGDQDTTRSTFDAALTDKDPNIRGLAVQTLANRGGPEATAYLWQGLRDPDPSVRIMAVQTAEPNDQGLAVLQEALSDTDASVRAIAKFRLRHGENLNGGR